MASRTGQGQKPKSTSKTKQKKRPIVRIELAVVGRKTFGCYEYGRASGAPGVRWR